MIGLHDGYTYVYVPVTTTTQAQPTIYHDIFIDKNVNCLRFSFRCDVIVRKYEQTVMITTLIVITHASQISCLLFQCIHTNAIQAMISL